MSFPKVPATQVIRLQPEFRMLDGHAPQFGGPGLLATLELQALPEGAATALDAMHALLAAALPTGALPDGVGMTLPERLLAWATAMQYAAGWPVFQNARALCARHRDPDMPDRWHLLHLPCQPHEATATAQALHWVVARAEDALRGMDPEASLSTLAPLRATLEALAPQGVNTLRFLQAAHDAGIPWRHVHGNVYRFGWGAQSRLLDSSFTDATPRIGAGLARDKTGAAAVLRALGMPVPAHRLARDANEAVAVAAQLGWPVVVKPADQDGGLGVQAGLNTPEAVRRAFVAARALSSRVLVEQHVDGRDHRLQVYQGEVYWVAERVPGGVTGDGTRSVAQLLQALNDDPQRSAAGPLQRLVFDDEASDLLAEQQLQADAVPAAGRFVRLRRAANISRGGVRVPLPLEKVHPDNLALAARAARALHLDLAGVDLLIPDIGRSWLEGGAALCEINAQPQLAPQLPGWLLQRMVHGQGRIPVVVVLGHPIPQALALALSEAMPGQRLGLATAAGVWIGGRRVAPGGLGVLAAGGALLADADVDVALLCLDGAAGLRDGLPVDRFDLLVLAGGPAAHADATAWLHWRHQAAALLPMSSAGAVGAAECVGWAPLLQGLPAGQGRRVPLPQLASAIGTVLSETPPGIGTRRQSPGIRPD